MQSGVEKFSEKCVRVRVGACGCVRACTPCRWGRAAVADVRCTTAHPFLCKKFPQNLTFSNKKNLKKKKFEKCFENFCGYGCACGRKNQCAGVCAAHYDFCAMYVQVRAKKSAH